jgi:ERF superfamily
MDKISAAFVKAQKAFGPALKTATNPHFKAKYANLSDCIEAVIDALNDNGIAMMQITHPDNDGVSVETKLIHESGEYLSSGVLHVPASKSDPQGYGSALTYARRYSLMAACGIAPEDDDGNAASKPKQQPIELITADQSIHIDDLLRDTNADKSAFFSWVSKATGLVISRTSQIPVAAYEPVVKQLKAKFKQ